jgi:hypothetical protein
MCQGRCGGIDRTTGFASELHNFETFDKKAGSKLCQLPESYFEAMEARKNAELKLAMTNVHFQTLFLGYMDDDSTSADSAALPETPQDSKPTLTDAVDDEAMSLATKVAAMSVSDEDKKRSLEFKAEGN